MKSVASVFCALLFLSVLGSAQGSEDVVGLVTKVDAGSINVTTKTGEVKTVVVGPSTKYAKGEASVTRKELKVQDRVVINTEPTGGTLQATKVTIGARTKKYPLQGEVVRKNGATGEITVTNREIPGFMAEMTMPYRVKDPAVVQAVQPGDNIVAEMVVAENHLDHWLEDIRVTDKSGRSQMKPQLAAHRLKPGDRVPNLPLINQDGHTIHLSDFSGKAVLITFIYTRCIMPDYCPRMSTQFARIHEELKKSPADYKKTHLLTITFDPQYDSPPVLRKYGLAYLGGDASGFSHWDFTTSSASDLTRLSQAFGLEFEQGPDEIYHTTSVALIAPNGTVAKLWSVDWKGPDLIAGLRQAAEGTAGGSGPYSRKQ